MKPTLNPVDAFDVSEGTTITFLCGNPIFGSKITIYDPQSKTAVSDFEIKPGMEPQYEILPDAAGLENGKQYEMTVTVYEDRLFSDFCAHRSDSRLFYCYKRPRFSISPIARPYYIQRNPSLSLSIDYQQENDEPLDMYHIRFYDENKKELSDSGEQYRSNSLKNVFSVSGLQNKTFYYFRGFGRTKHGMELDTGFLKVFTSFINYESSSNLRLENHYHSGEITGEVALNTVLYTSQKPVRFEDNTIADLKDNTLTYNSGLRIGENFSLYMEIQDANPDSCFAQLTDVYGNPLRFYYSIHKKYDTGPARKEDGTSPAESDEAIVEYKPYFSIEAGSQRYVTDYFSSAASLSELSQKHYSVAIAKCQDTLNIRVKESESSHSDSSSLIFTEEHIFDISTAALSSAKFDCFYVSTDTDLEQYKDGMPKHWQKRQADDNSSVTDVTLLMTDFPNTCNACSVGFEVKDVTKLIIRKRRKNTGENWKDFLIKDIIAAQDFNFTFHDRYCAGRASYQYSIVLVANNVEADLNISADIYSDFEGWYLADAENFYGSRFNLERTISRNTASSSVNTLSGRYPFIARSSALNYTSGNISGLFIECKNGHFDTEGSFAYRNSFYDFLTNGMPKLLKFDTGESMFVQIGDQISQNESEIAYAPSTSFDFTEIGDAKDHQSFETYGFLPITGG